MGERIHGLSTLDEHGARARRRMDCRSRLGAEKSKGEVVQRRLQRTADQNAMNFPETQSAVRCKDGLAIVE
jgi:hypothetical protein